ncbi:MAG: hypothetical protein WAL94_05780 [Bacteroidales bacterium]
MSELPVIVPDDDPELIEYIKRNTGISRTRLNVQAFIGLFIFGWLMSMNYDALRKKGLGWAFLIIFAILLITSYQVQPGLWFLAIGVYLGAWIHTNVLLTQQQKEAKEKFIAWKNEPVVNNTFQSADGSSIPTENTSEGRLLTPGVKSIVEKSTDPQVTRLLAFTHQAWKLGTLDFFSDNFKNAAIKTDLINFIKTAEMPLVNLLKASNGARAFEDGEYMIGYANKNFLLTNKVIYFHLRDNSAGSPVIIRLNDIKTYNTQTSFNNIKVNIEMKSGDPVFIPKIKSVPDEKLIALLIKAS